MRSRGAERRGRNDLGRATPARPNRARYVLLCFLAVPAGCGVAGLPTEADTSFVVGTLPAVSVGREDKLIGQAANEAGRCIYETSQHRRLRAPCPPDYRP